jgi:hypothetical protein
MMRARAVGASVVGLVAASVLTLGTLSQAFADDHVKGTGTKQLSGCGKLDAHGSGTVHLQLDGDADIDVKGQATINEDSSHVSVDEGGDLTRDSLSGDNVRYNGHGKLKINGSNIVADVIGGDAHIKGNGCGSITLTGTGDLHWHGDDKGKGNDNHDDD